jgi:aminoglycoside phosphotransferase (APT) family kinase protein
MENVESLDAWWPRIETLPKTLIHNDLNPRNIAFRREMGGLRACFYDWELAGMGLPQRDLVEFLCFVLKPEDVERTASRYMEQHRRELERASFRVIDRGAWQEGFGLALREFLLTRLPMYAIVYRFRSEAFLPRAVAVWQALEAWHARLEAHELLG